MKILLVDDDALLRDMYATKFTEAGHTVQTAGNGEQAMELLKEETFDVALMDMVMPGVTGIKLLEEVQRLGLGDSMKCIILSNQSGESDVAAAKEKGVIGYIVKAEMVPSEVVKKVEELVGAK